MEMILLGTTNNNSIIFGNYDITTYNGYPEFTADFDTVHPFKFDNGEIQCRLDSLVDDLDKDTIIDWCNEYRCCPDELAGTVYSDLGTDELIELTYDTSLYPNTIYDKNGDEWNFESECCGQHDPRVEIDTIYDNTLFTDLMELWDRYHLREFKENNPDMAIYDRMMEHAEKWSECSLVEQTISKFIDDNF